MWEKVIAIGTVILIILTAVLVWQGFNRPAVNWPLLGTVTIVALAFVTAAILNFKAANRQLPRRGANSENAELVTPPMQEKHVWFFSPGICVYLNRSVGSVIVNLQILSTEQTELIFIRVDLRDSTGKIAITCEHSEPIMIDKLIPSSKTIEQKISPQELEAFQRGMMLTVNGYAKFRDGAKMTQSQFQLTTIPSI